MAAVLTKVPVPVVVVVTVVVLVVPPVVNYWFVAGRDSQSGEPRLPHLPLLQLWTHEEKRRLLPAAVQLAVRDPLVGRPQPPRGHLRLPAAPLPPEALRHPGRRRRGGEAPMLRRRNPADVCVCVLL